MNLDELVAALIDIEHALNQRTEVWRVIVDAKGNPVKRIFSFSFKDERPPHVRQTT